MSQHWNSRGWSGRCSLTDQRGWLPRETSHDSIWLVCSRAIASMIIQNLLPLYIFRGNTVGISRFFEIIISKCLECLPDCSLSHKSCTLFLISLFAILVKCAVLGVHVAISIERITVDVAALLLGLHRHSPSCRRLGSLARGIESNLNLAQNLDVISA